ncbi:MAG: glycosyltransferase family 87 protein [Pseudomonadota bacterium]
MTRTPIYRQFRRALLFGVIVLMGYCVVFGGIFYDLMSGVIPRVGDDFSVFWQALHVAKTDGIAMIYDNTHLSALYAERFGGKPEGVFAAESPFYYLMSRHLGNMSYAWALLFFVGLNLYAWAIAIRLVWPQLHMRGFILAFASAYMFFTLSFGQNGGLIAVLLVGGFLAQHKNLSRLSGILASLLLIAPGFLSAFVLLYAVKRDFRAISTFVIVCAIWFCVTGWFAGFEVWATYWHAQSDYIRYLGSSESYAFFGSLLTTGAGFGLSTYILVILHLLSVLLAVGIYLSVQRAQQFSLDFVAFLLAAMLMNPYLAHYNMAALTIAAIMLMRLLPRKRRTVWRFAILFFWLAPVVAAATFNSIGIPIYGFAVLALVACLLVVLWERSHQTR